MKSRAWYVKWPQAAYAIGPMYFDPPITEHELRERIRRIEGLKRLPNGFQCWPAG